jgi:N-acetylglucosaminyldiphosphoundecaprenol N-acetyl-beta-D-mannosaminyltransferase
LFGLDFIDDVSIDATVERLLETQPDDDREPVLYTPNVDDVVQLEDLGDDVLAVRLRRARYILPDGQPIVWASRLLGRPLRSRLPGSDLVPPLWQRLCAEGRSVVVVASSEDVAQSLRSEHPTATTFVPPFFPAGDGEALSRVLDDVEALIEQTRPNLVFLGISFPKQQHIAFGLIDRLGHRPGTPVFLLVGGSFNMYTGRVRRAPRWMRRVGAEWLFRFLLEPRRLFRRYFLVDTRFFAIVARELRNQRQTRGGAR